MRRRLEQLLNETFEYEVPRLGISVSELEIEAGEGETVHGSLVVSHPEGKRVKGFVYSSSPRLVPEQGEFNSPKAEIRWRADVTGLEAGSGSDGQITISSELGEETIPFRIRVKRKAEGEKRDIPDPDQLAELAQNDFAAACEIYDSKDTDEAWEQESFECMTLRRSLKDESDRRHALEQFLIGMGKKEPVELSLSEERRQIADPRGTVLEQTELTKNTWGYLEAEISSDARFLRVEKRHVTTEDFIGSVWPVRYIIDSNFLHAGRNLGRITIRTSYQTLTYELCVEVKGGRSLREHRVQNVMARRAICLYHDYRLGKITLHQWGERTNSVIGSYRRSGGESIYADLLEVFVLHAEGKRASAERELHRIERTSQIRTDESAQAAWLYLSTFFDRDSSYRDSVRQQFRNILLRNRSSWLVRWLSLYIIPDELGGESGKLDLILKHIENYTASTILLLEGMQIIRQDPFLLHEWSKGTCMLVNFALMQKAADERLILHSMNLIRRRGGFDAPTFRFLGRCYESCRLDDVLQVWTRMAIDGQRTEQKYFSLYQMAVARDLKVTGLYEYYMDTMEEVRIEQMPEVIRRFFVMNESLDWRKRARIYRNLSDSEGSIPQIFSAMRRQVERFILDQIQMGRINHDLAVLISRYLKNEQITSQVAKKLLKLLFTFEVDCLSPSMKRVIITDVRQHREKVVEIVDHSAQVRIYSEQSRILLEDEEGRRYSSTSLYMAQHLLDDTRLMNECVQKIPEDPYLVLFFTLNPRVEQPITSTTLRFYLEAARMSALSSSYRLLIRTWLLDYYCHNPQEKTISGFLRGVDLESYVRIDRRKVLSLLTQEGRYERAWSIIEKYGIEGVDLNRLMRILSQTVMDREYEEDRTLLSFCARLFGAGKVEEHVLIYLIMYYDGPVESMKSLWRVAKEYELDTINLEKKILSMIIFTREGGAGSEQIYLSYRRSLGSRRICQAYVISRCYEYLVKGKPVQEVVFDDCRKDYEKGGRLPDVCALALLQYLSTVPELTKEQEKTAQELLDLYAGRGMRFAFFLRFPIHMRCSFGGEDKVFCEAVADPKSVVKLFYRYKHDNEPFIEITMRDVFEGIRVREFVLFEGEQIECYTSETKENGETIVGSHRFLKAQEIPDEIKGSRYGRLTQIEKYLEHDDREGLEHSIREYYQMDHLTKELFTLM